jgi:hypothetical protein
MRGGSLRPGFGEVSDRISEIIARTDAIEDELRTLEIEKEEGRRRFRVADEFQRPRCVAVPNRVHTRVLNGGSQQCMNQILNLINSLRGEVTDLAARQDQMKADLDRIRGRLC